MAKRDEALVTTTPLGVAVFQEGVGFVRPGGEYAWVQIGAAPELPAWHVQSQPNTYAFPSDAAAMRFGQEHKRLYPDRVIRVATIDGEKHTL
ncbi:hypothetical protein MycrhDRAFT_5751 [Mycolicibacterium rhodesiae JS60]|nr:hypothetical protein MycrhDRAFT_5751 [Mycolicibacterium rhodesiae JS60]